jgi:endonuclease/exonuclease/phosphatase family metal-dependent hydrolase
MSKFRSNSLSQIAVSITTCDRTLCCSQLDQIDCGGGMKLATFNLESFGTDRIDEDLLARRIDALRPKLLELEADILCLQEVNAQKIKGQSSRQFYDLERLIEGTPYQDFSLSGSLRPSGKGPGDRHNLVVLSRYPVLSGESLYHRYAEPPLWRPGTADPGYDEPQATAFDRPVQQLQIDMGTGHPLHVFNVHLRAPDRSPNPRRQRRGAQLGLCLCLGRGLSSVGLETDCASA